MASFSKATVDSYLDNRLSSAVDLYETLTGIDYNPALGPSQLPNCDRRGNVEVPMAVAFGAIRTLESLTSWMNEARWSRD